MKKIIRLTESQLYRLIEQTINEMTDDYDKQKKELELMAPAFIGHIANCGGDANRGGQTREIGDTKVMRKSEACKAYPLHSNTRPLYYHCDYMEPRLGDDDYVLVLFDTNGRCLTWINGWKVRDLYNDLQNQNPNNDLVLRLY